MKALIRMCVGCHQVLGFTIVNTKVNCGDLNPIYRILRCFNVPESHGVCMDCIDNRRESRKAATH